MAVAQSERVVVSLSTIPSRCGELEPTLRSIAAQTRKPDAVYVSVSKVSTRENKPYPVKDLAKTVKSILPGIGKVAVLDEDYGPLTKLMGALMAETDPATLIITVDDDQSYGHQLVETLVRGAREHPGGVVCLCGHVVGKFPHVWGFRCSRKEGVWPLKHLYLRPGSRVDVISGWCGVLYPRGVFGTDVPHPAMEALRKESLRILHRHDDLYISAWLDLLKVNKYVVAYEDQTGGQDEQLAHANKNSLSMGDSGPTPAQGIKHLNEFWGVVRALRSRGMLASGLRVEWYKSTVTMATIGTVVLAVGAVGLIVYLRHKSQKK